MLLKKIANVHAMKINKYILGGLLILFPILWNSCAVSEKNKNRHMKPNKIILKDSTKKIQVFVTSYHSTQRIRQEIIIKENQPVNFFGIDFVLRKGILYAKRNKEEKTFFSPGSYYIDISPIDGTWVSGKVHTPFEGKYHPKQ